MASLSFMCLEIVTGLGAPSPSRNQGDTGLPIVFWVLLLHLLDSRTDIFFSLAISHPLQLPHFFKIIKSGMIIDC